MAKRLGPAHPLAITWNGAGACVIFSQSRQVNFSRTVSIAELAQSAATAALTCRRRIDHHALPGKVVGQCIAFRTPARKSGDRRRLSDRSFRRQFVFRRTGLQFLEREGQLLDQTF